MPWQISASEWSKRKASDNPCERPRWISCPAPLISLPGSGSAGRRKVIESSAVVISWPAGRSPCTTEPSAASPITARIPAITPAELANQSEAGISNSECPREPAVIRSSVR